MAKKIEEEEAVMIKREQTIKNSKIELATNKKRSNKEIDLKILE